MMRRLFFIVIAALSMVACEKIIDIDYRSVAKMYVINSYTNSAETCVSITLTTDMDDVLDKTLCEATSVVVTDKYNISHTLNRQNDGSYFSQTAVAQQAGDSFLLDVEIDGEHYISTSEVVSAPNISAMEIIQIEAVGLKAYACYLLAQRTVSEDSYYKYELYVGDDRILWGVVEHEAANEQPITLSMIFAAEINGKILTTDSTQSEIFRGADIEVSLMAIDKRAYDYLSTLSLSSQSSSNPVDNFSGGALGYYSAFITNSWSTTF